VYAEFEREKVSLLTLSMSTRPGDMADVIENMETDGQI